MTIRYTRNIFNRGTLANLFTLQNHYFVAETGTTRPQGTVRNLIRSQARRKPRNARVRPLQDQQVASSAVTQRVSIGSISNAHSKGVHTLPDPHGTQGNHVLDPFSPLPSVALSEWNVTQELLQHCRWSDLAPKPPFCVFPMRPARLPHRPEPPAVSTRNVLRRVDG